MSPGGGDILDLSLGRERIICSHSDLLIDETEVEEGREEMRLINWSRKRVTDRVDVGCMSIIGTCMLN